MSKTFYFNVDELYRFRVVNHLSQEQLAAHLGITKPALNRIETSICDPSMQTLANLAYLYTVDGAVEFERLFNALPFGLPDPEKFILPVLGDRRRPSS